MAGDRVACERAQGTPAADELPELLALLEACAVPVADLAATHRPGRRGDRRLIAVAGLEASEYRHLRPASVVCMVKTVGGAAVP